MKIDKKTKGMALLSVVLIATIAGGLFLMAQASNTDNPTDFNNDTDNQLATVTTISDDANEETEKFTDIVPFGDAGMMGPMRFGKHMRGFGGPCMAFGPIEISDEYKAAVNTILEADTDVQKLIDDGYNVTRIMPIVKTTIDGEGNVVTKATSATAILTKEDAGVAIVSVDLAQDKVTQIVNYTKTVIEK
jgi:hypothetical protein